LSLVDEDISPSKNHSFTENSENYNSEQDFDQLNQSHQPSESRTRNQLSNSKNAKNNPKNQDNFEEEDSNYQEVSETRTISQNQQMKGSNKKGQTVEQESVYDDDEDFIEQESEDPTKRSSQKQAQDASSRRNDQRSGYHAGPKDFLKGRNFDDINSDITVNDGESVHDIWGGNRPMLTEAQKQRLIENLNARAITPSASRLQPDRDEDPSEIRSNYDRSVYSSQAHSSGRRKKDQDRSEISRDTQRSKRTDRKDSMTSQGSAISKKTAVTEINIRDGVLTSEERAVFLELRSKRKSPFKQSRSKT